MRGERDRRRCSRRRCPAIPTITIPVNAFEMPSALTAGSSAFDEPVGDERGADACDGEHDEPGRERERNVCALLERGLAAIAPQVAPEPDAVDGEQADGADGRDRDRMLARPVADRVREPEQDDDEDGEQEQRRRVVRQRASGSASRRRRADSEPATIARPSTSSAFANSEPRIDVCATTTSPAESAKRTTKSSGRFPSVDCSTPVSRRAEAGADGLGREADHPREPGERCGRDEEHGHRRRRPRSGARR